MRRGLFLVSLPIFFINFSVPIQAKGLGANAFEIGLLFSVFTLSLLTLRPLVGYGLDHIGRKLFLCLALLFYVAANASYALADSMTWMYVARFTQGIGAALLLITIDTITTDLSTESERAVEMGRNMETQTRSSIVGATIGFSFVGATGALAWQNSFGIFAVLTALGFLFLLVRFEETYQPKTDKPEFVMTDGLKRLCLIVLATGFANALILPIYLIYLQDKFDLSLQLLSAAFLPAAIVFAVLPSRVGRLSQKFGTLNLMTMGIVGSGLIYLLLPVMQNLWVFILLYTISAVGWAMAEPARKSLTAALSENSDTTGRSFGVAELYSGIGATIGPPLGGLIYDNYGATTTFVTNGMLLLGTALVAWFLLRQFQTQ